MSNRSWTVGEPTVVEIDEPVARLDATLVRGRIDIVAHEGTGSRVEVHAVSGRPIEVSLAGRTLKVGYRNVSVSGFLDKLRSFRADESADVQITVPAEVALRLAVIKGDGLVAGLHGDARVSTVGGPLVVDQCAGSMKASTVSGELVVRDFDGTLTASTVSGPVTVSGGLSELTASSVSGDLTMDLTAAPRIAKISSVSGDVVLRAPQVERLRLKLSAASGRVTVDGVEHPDPRHKGIHIDPKDPVGAAVVSVVSGDLTILRRTEHEADVDATVEAGV
jgi:DUF4097 and DUF4098 domain-containing protein YvlB